MKDLHAENEELRRQLEEEREKRKAAERGELWNRGFRIEYQRQPGPEWRGPREPPSQQKAKKANGTVIAVLGLSAVGFVVVLAIIGLITVVRALL